jgi:hypothetical protein
LPFKAAAQAAARKFGAVVLLAGNILVNNVLACLSRPAIDKPLMPHW